MYMRAVSDVMTPRSMPCAGFAEAADDWIRAAAPGMYLRSSSWKWLTRAMTWWLSVGCPAFVRSSDHWACSWFLTRSSMAFHTACMPAWAA